MAGGFPGPFHGPSLSMQSGTGIGRSGGMIVPPTCQTSSERDPAAINGDLPLSRADREAYMRHHAQRNSINAARSRDDGILTRPVPFGSKWETSASSPARVMTAHFFEHAAHRLRPWFASRPITILDLGCGRGRAVLPLFAEMGYHGHYIGVDIQRHAGWSDAPLLDSRLGARFTKQLIVGDINRADLDNLPPIDLLVSCTSLEHIRDDRGAVERITARLAPCSAQAHYIPGEGALPLYQPHGWRQYSPRCLRELFPTGDLYRAGGSFSSELHLRAFTTAQASKPWREAHPKLYHVARDLALRADRLCGNWPPTMYGVIVEPASRPESPRALRTSALQRAA